jgi:hypothetical protein
MADDPAAKESAPAPTVAFHFIKSNQFRVIRVDGGHGGVTPSGQVQIAFYSERLPIPQKTVHRLTPEGLEDTPVEVVSREGLVREVEVEAVMDVGTARSVADFLLKRAQEAETQMRAAHEKRSK